MSRRMLVVDDEATMRSAMVQVLKRGGHTVDSAEDAVEALSLVARREYDIVVSDLRMPGLSGHELLCRIRALQPKIAIVLVTAHGTVESAVACVRDGASNYLLKPFSPEQLATAVEEALPAKAGESNGPGEPTLVAEDPRTLETLDLALRAAAVDATVLLEAESGAGKEVFARLIHRESKRAAGPFVAVNCAAFPKELLEAELFGHSKGAFTGATRERKGHFQVAHGGTLLLDEIGEMSADLQSRLLRVMQDRVIQPVGYDSQINVDVRIVAATHRNLREEVAQQRFREDLYYRLRVFPIRIPPLRERPADVEPLVLRCARRHGGPGATITPRARQRLLAHSWPGNVRELENVIQRAAILCAGQSIDVAHLDLEPGPRAPASGETPLSLEEAERETIRQALLGSGGNRTSAAAALGEGDTAVQTVAELQAQIAQGALPPDTAGSPLRRKLIEAATEDPETAALVASTASAVESLNLGLSRLVAQLQSSGVSQPEVSLGVETSADPGMQGEHPCGSGSRRSDERHAEARSPHADEPRERDEPDAASRGRLDRMA